MFYLLLEETLFKQVFPEFEKRAKKLVSVLATSKLAIGSRKNVVETADAAGKNGKESEGKYPKNLA